jgi:hypothetical protein
MGLQLRAEKQVVFDWPGLPENRNNRVIAKRSCAWKALLSSTLSRLVAGAVRRVAS